MAVKWCDGVVWRSSLADAFRNLNSAIGHGEHAIHNLNSQHAALPAHPFRSRHFSCSCAFAVHIQGLARPFSLDNLASSTPRAENLRTALLLARPLQQGRLARSLHRGSSRFRAMAAKRAHLPSPAAERGSTVQCHDANIPSHTVFRPVPSASHFDDDVPAPRVMKRRRTSAIAAPDDRNALAAAVAATDAASRNVAPFLAKHIPTTYANQTSSSAFPAGMEPTKYCNRHRPDIKCRRQANEPTMSELQNVGGLFPFG
jgi:hypothetical protein